MMFLTLKKNIICIIKIVIKVKPSEICLLLASAKTGFAISEIIQIVKEIFKIATKDSLKIIGYNKVLSTPSVILKTVTYISSPTTNSAGQTRLPTFSMITTSNLSRSKSPSTSSTIGASK